MKNVLPPADSEAGGEADGPWVWKVKQNADNARLRLLYEPGNWGDILKGTWAILITRALVALAPGRTFRALDPFAGARSYPLSPHAAQRIAWLGAGPFVEAQQSWLAQGEIASTGMLVHETASAGDAPSIIRVFDTDQGRLASWKDMPGALQLNLTSGEAALDQPEADLILIDPYDLFDHWRQLLPLAAKASKRALVLLYIYNKSPRGSGYFRSYQVFRRRVSEETCGSELIGRIPGDLILPRGFHEVILLGLRAEMAHVAADLSQATRELASRMSGAGSMEAGENLEI